MLDSTILRMLSSKNVNDSQVSLEATKNTNFMLTFTASDWNGTNKTLQAMYVRKYVLVCNGSRWRQACLSG